MLNDSTNPTIGTATHASASASASALTPASGRQRAVRLGRQAQLHTVRHQCSTHYPDSNPPTSPNPPFSSLPSTKAVGRVQSTWLMSTAAGLRCVTTTWYPSALARCRHSAVESYTCGGGEGAKEKEVCRGRLAEPTQTH